MSDPAVTTHYRTVYYGKKRYVPDQCPACGIGAYKYGDHIRERWERKIFLPRTKPLKPGFGTRRPKIDIGYFDFCLKQRYGHWNKCFTKRRPGWDIPSWYGDCGKCSMERSMFSGMSFLSALKPKKEFQGGSLPIPIMYGKAK